MLESVFYWIEAVLSSYLVFRLSITSLIYIDIPGFNLLNKYFILGVSIHKGETYSL